jgi:hypothetical protein
MPRAAGRPPFAFEHSFFHSSIVDHKITSPSRANPSRDHKYLPSWIRAEIGRMSPPRSPLSQRPSPAGRIHPALLTLFLVFSPETRTKHLAPHPNSSRNSASGLPAFFASLRLGEKPLPGRYPSGRPERSAGLPRPLPPRPLVAQALRFLCFLCASAWKTHTCLVPAAPG